MDIDIEKSIRQNHIEFKKIILECETLRGKKVSDYGLSYNEYGYVGLLVKLGDKYSRIKRLYEKSIEGNAPNFETSRDSLVDLINYSVMAIMELDNKKIEQNWSKHCKWHKKEQEIYKLQKDGERKINKIEKELSRRDE